MAKFFPSIGARINPVLDHAQQLLKVAAERIAYLAQLRLADHLGAEQLRVIE